MDVFISGGKSEYYIFYGQWTLSMADNPQGQSSGYLLSSREIGHKQASEMSQEEPY